MAAMQWEAILSRRHQIDRQFLSAYDLFFAEFPHQSNEIAKVNIVGLIL